jgi:stage III sporulation protein AG
MKDKLKRLIKKGGGIGFAVIIMAFGILLLMLPSGSKEKAPAADPTPTPETFSLPDTENRIADALGQIAGAGRVTVVLTLKSDGLTEIATDKSYSEKGESGARTERDQSEKSVIIGSGSSAQSPIVTRRGYPEFQGALIVAEGADDPVVRLALTQAITALTGLGSDKVTVAKMK